MITNQTPPLSPSRLPSCSLFRAAWEERDGKMEPLQATDLFVWAYVNTKTGEVEMTEIQAFDDDLCGNLVEGWEWRRFRLIEANADSIRTETNP